MSAHPSQVLWRCRRGARELDLLLEAHVKNRYDVAPEAERQAFVELLELPDDELAGYVLGSAIPDDFLTRQIVAQIRSRSVR